VRSALTGCGSQWTSPIGITSIYAHPVEHVLSNVLPIGIGPLLLGSHIVVFWYVRTQMTDTREASCQTDTVAW
jgi:hypothetical protein